MVKLVEAKHPKLGQVVHMKYLPSSLTLLPKISAIIILQIGLVFSGFGQRKVKVEDFKYRRSSLQVMMMESAAYPKKDTVEDAFKTAPFPDKYNNHTVSDRSFNPKDYGGSLEHEEVSLKPVKGHKAGKPEDRKACSEYLKQNQVARKMVAKWFNRGIDGSFNMDLIAERGYYNASEMEASIAAGSVRGVSSLADAGEELIKNTFVVISKLNFVKNEPIARVARDVALAAAADIENEFARGLAEVAANAGYEMTKDGYTVVTTAYLYQLRWNDSIAAVFYQDYWVNEGGLNMDRILAFETSDIFSMEFVGAEKASSMVLISAGRSEAEIIREATIRNVDNVYVKLQKKFDVFKTKTPLISVDPCMAQIGLKEGVSKGDKFDVLEQTVDPKTGLTKYVKKGQITAIKNMIWDNRYSPGIEEAPKTVDTEDGIDDLPADSVPNPPVAPNDSALTDSTKTDSQVALKSAGGLSEKPDKKSKKGKDEPLTATHFKCSGKLYPGMLLRQVK